MNCAAIPGSYKPLAVFRVAVIEHDGAPIDLGEAELLEDALLAMTRN